jgi:hypothetical protein
MDGLVVSYSAVYDVLFGDVALVADDVTTS